MIFFTGGQQFVQFRLTADAAQGGLGQLGDGVNVFFHLHDGLDGIDHPEVDHGIDLDRHIVPGDHVLGIHIHGHQPHAHLDHLVHDGNEDDQPRPLGLDHPAEAENDPPFVFVENTKRCGQEQDDQDNGPDIRQHGFLLWPDRTMMMAPRPVHE